MNCPKCKQDMGLNITSAGLVCAYCGELRPQPELAESDATPMACCTADHSIMSADGSEEIAHITLDTDGAHIDGMEAMILVEIFARHTKRFIRNKLVKRAN